MKVVVGPPRLLVFLIRWRIGQPPPTAIITYGRTIYRLTPQGNLPRDLLVHEETHCRQQGRTPFVWWVRYLASPRFRITQEAEAYRAQLESATMLDRYRRQLFRREFALVLSGSMYGYAVSATEAWRLLGG